MLKHRTRLFLLLLGVTAIAATTGVFVANAPAASDPVGERGSVTSRRAHRARLQRCGQREGDAHRNCAYHRQRDGRRARARSLREHLWLQARRAQVLSDGVRPGARSRPKQGGHRHVPGLVRIGSSRGSARGEQGQASSRYIAGITDANTNGNSPHNRGIEAAQAALASSSTKALVLFSDGQTAQAAAAAAATTAKAQGIRIATVGIGTGTGVDAAALTELGVADRLLPVRLRGLQRKRARLRRRRGGRRSGSVHADRDAGDELRAQRRDAGATVGGVESSRGAARSPMIRTQPWNYTATRNGDVDLFSVTEEDDQHERVDRSPAAAAQSAPATRTIDVLPCDASSPREEDVHRSTACTAGGTTSNGLSTR